MGPYDRRPTPTPFGVDERMNEMKESERQMGSRGERAGLTEGR